MHMFFGFAPVGCLCFKQVCGTNLPGSPQGKGPAPPRAEKRPPLASDRPLPPNHQGKRGEGREKMTIQLEDRGGLGLGPGRENWSSMASPASWSRSPVSPTNTYCRSDRARATSRRKLRSLRQPLAAGGPPHSPKELLANGLAQTASHSLRPPPARWWGGPREEYPFLAYPPG